MTVICVGPCGEEVEEAQVNADGVCNLCVIEAGAAAAAAGGSVQEPQQESETAGAPLF